MRVLNLGGSALGEVPGGPALWCSASCSREVYKNRKLYVGVPGKVGKV